MFKLKNQSEILSQFNGMSIHASGFVSNLSFDNNLPDSNRIYYVLTNVIVKGMDETVIDHSWISIPKKDFKNNRILQDLVGTGYLEFDADVEQYYSEFHGQTYTKYGMTNLRNLSEVDNGIRLSSIVYSDSLLYNVRHYYNDVSAKISDLYPAYKKFMKDTYKTDIQSVYDFLLQISMVAERRIKTGILPPEINGLEKYIPYIDFRKISVEDWELTINQITDELSDYENTIDYQVENTSKYNLVDLPGDRKVYLSNDESSLLVEVNPKFDGKKTLFSILFDSSKYDVLKNNDDEDLYLVEKLSSEIISKLEASVNGSVNNRIYRRSNITSVTNRTRINKMELVNGEYLKFDRIKNGTDQVDITFAFLKYAIDNGYNLDKLSLPYDYDKIQKSEIDLNKEFDEDVTITSSDLRNTLQSLNLELKLDGNDITTNDLFKIIMDSTK